MRKIIVTEFITLDGVVESPGGDETDHPHGGWQFENSHPEMGNYKKTELFEADALLLGGNTYRQFAGYWPGKTDTAGFADKINELPKYVVSSSLQSVEWQNSYILRDVTKDITALKATEGGNILVYGSATLVKELLLHDLVDELRLMVYPVSIGGGLRLFDDNRLKKTFGLKRFQVLDNGVAILEYEPRKL